MASKRSKRAQTPPGSAPPRDPEARVRDQARPLEGLSGMAPDTLRQDNRDDRSDAAIEFDARMPATVEEQQDAADKRARR